MLPHDVEDFEAQVVGAVRSPLDAWAVVAVGSGFRGRWASCVEVARSRRPRGVIHSDFQGGLRGVAAEHHGAEWDGGVTAGSGHVGGMLRWRRPLQELTVTGFWNRTSRSCGVDWSGRRGPWDMQSALALTSEGVSWRTSTRWAHGRSFVIQVSGTAQFEEGEARGQMQGFATWVQPQSGAMVQMRVRRLEQGEWDLRLKGRPSKHHP